MKFLIFILFVLFLAAVVLSTVVLFQQHMNGEIAAARYLSLGMAHSGYDAAKAGKTWSDISNEVEQAWSQTIATHSKELHQPSH